MKEAVLYVLTALVTGLNNFYLLANAINGAPIDIWNCIALVGSATLLGAAILVLFRPRVAANAALVGLVLLWLFYLPLIVASVLTPFSTWNQIHFYISFHDYAPVVVLLLSPMLLAACTVRLSFFSKPVKEYGNSPVQ